MTVCTPKIDRPEAAPSCVRPAAEVTRELNVCHVAATTEGATWMLEQLRELRDEHGCQVTAVVSGETGGLVDKLRRENIAVRSQDFRFAGLRELLRLPRSICSLARLFRRERFDVVQTHLFASMILGRIAAWLADVPVRLTMVAGPFHLEAHTPRWIDAATCWMDTTLIGSCRHTLDLYRGLGAKNNRLALIYYGPDERKFCPESTPPAQIRSEFGWPVETPLVALIAYFYAPLPSNSWIPESVQGRAIKGHEDLIKAAPEILREFPDARILLVGKGWEAGGAKHMDEMRQLVQELGLQDRVVFTGFRTDVNNILRAVDVAVQASLNENLGGTIESLLMACPTVATRVGGLVDSVIDEQTGILVRPADPQDLARGIRALLRDPARSKRLAHAGRDWMRERFTLRRTVDDLHQLYRQKLFANQRRLKGYRWYASLWRLLIGTPLFFYLALRLVVCDYNQIGIWRQQMRSRFFAAVCKVSTRLGSVRRCAGNLRCPAGNRK
ncbi:MAG TPA: glycosyltransferase family 4 protein [Planctomycetaceae bacterium]|jgi:glycosyltransferase involved in cell wall biosynthesis